MRFWTPKQDPKKSSKNQKFLTVFIYEISTKVVKNIVDLLIF
jgi:hypothetical protein